MSTAEKGEKFETKGQIGRSYCKCCDKFVKVYVIYEGGGNNMTQQVYYGIKNKFDDYINKIHVNKIQELKEIKKREKFSIEKTDEFYFINFYELDTCGHIEPISDTMKSEENAIQNALKHFHKIIDNRINNIEELYHEETQIINIVVDESKKQNGKFVKCPECGNEINKYITEKSPCPKCGGKLRHVDTIIWD